MLQHFGGEQEALGRCNAVSVQYKDRIWEIELENVNGCIQSISLDLQAALNLAKPPVGLRLRVAPGAEAVVCPLSVLVACPSFIATTFQGMSWIPLMEGWGEEDETDLPFPPPTDPFLPPPLGSPMEQDLSMLTDCGSTASPSEGCGRPLTAPPGDRTRGMARQRPGRREGLGRPMSATPSDKSFGMRRFRPGKREGFGRPGTALPSDHSGSGSPAWGLPSPHGFGCEESYDDARPATAPAFASGGPRRLSSSGLGGARNNGIVPPQRFRQPDPGRGGFQLGDADRGEDGGGGLPSSVDVGYDGAGIASWEWCRSGKTRECWG